MTESQPITKRFQEYAVLLSIIPLMVGIIVLIGWSLDSKALTQFNSQWVSVKPISALAMSLFTISIALFSNHNRLSSIKEKHRITLGIVINLIILTGMVTTLVSNFLGFNLGLDRLFFQSSPRPEQGMPADSVSPLTGSIVIAYSLALLSSTRTKKTAALANTFNFLGLILSLMALLGYAFRVSSLYKIGVYSAVPLPSALSLFIIGISIFLLHSERGASSILTKNTSGSIFLRKALPFTLIIPFIIGYLRYLGELYGLYDWQFGLVLMVASITILMNASVWIAAIRLNSIEIEKKLLENERAKSLAAQRASEELAKSKQFLDHLIEHIPSAILVKDAQTLKIVHVNRAGEKLLGSPFSQVMGKSIFDFLPEDQATVITARERNALLEGKPSEPFEHITHTKTGTYSIRTQHVPILDEFREPNFLLSISEDITGIKQVETERDIFFTASLDMCSVAGMDGYFKRVNPVCKSILGYTPEEFCSTPYLDLIHPDDIESTMKAVDRLSNGESVIAFENRYRTKDGRYRWLSWRSVPVGSTLYGVARDVTEEKLEIQDTKQNFKAVADHMPLLAWLVNSEGHFLWTNKRWLDYLGMIPKTVFDPCWRDLIHPEDIEKYLSIIKTAFDQGVEYKIEYRLKKASSGQYHWFQGRSVPIFDQDGKVVKWVGTSTDIQSQKKHLQELVESKRRTDMVVNSIDGVLWAADRDGLITFYQGKGLDRLGLRSEERIGKNVFQLNLENPTLIEALHKALDGSEVETEVLQRGQWFQSYISPIEDTDGNIDGIVGVSLNITRQKLAEAELKRREIESEKARIAVHLAEESSKLKSQFLANMSHEIRTPINGIIGMTGELLDTNLNPDQRNCAEIVVRSADTLLTLINDILDFSKIEAGKLDFEIVEFNLNQLLSDIHKTLLFSAQQKNLPLLLEGNKTWKHLFKGDPGRIRQVLSNLLSNAIKFTLEGQVILRALVLQEDDLSTEIRFEIIDSGIGIPAAAREKIFKSFSQVDSSVARRFGGTGLGLSISKHLVELMNGEIGFTSEEHRGSTFWFKIRLPKGRKITNLPKPPISVLHSKDPTTSRHTIRILLAEDNAVNQKVSMRQLKKLGFQAEVVEDGQKVIEALRSAPYDLILMDCQMPNLDGYEATRIIRAHQEAPFNNIVIVALTANALPSERDKCLAVGMNDYISKPIHIDDLNRVLEKWETEIETRRQFPGC